MIEQNIKFSRDGFVLDGAFFVGESSSNPKLPIVIVCSGFTGLKNIHPERFSRALTQRVYCFRLRLPWLL